MPVYGVKISENSQNTSSSNDKGDDGKTAKQNLNYSTLAELQRNEATARMKPKIQRTSTDRASGTDESEIHVAEDDPCSEKRRREKTPQVEQTDVPKFRRTPGLDPRFQQANQTLRCWVMYTDFYRCEKILGNGNEACTWFRDVFTAVCPNAWVRRWDEQRETGRFPWNKEKTQGVFPGDRYGD